MKPIFNSLIPAKKSAALARLEALVDRIGEVVESCLAQVVPEAIADIPLRLIPSFMKAYVDSFAAIQVAHDGASGYELVCTELPKIHATLE